MTTIAEFLNKTSNNFSGYLYKEANQASTAPTNTKPDNLWNKTVQTVTPYVEQGAQFLWNNRAKIQNGADLIWNGQDYLSGNRENNRQFLQNYNTWNRFNTNLGSILQQDQFKEYAPYFNMMNKDRGAQNILLDTVNNTVNDYYARKNDNFNSFRNDFNINGVTIQPDLQQEIIANVQKQIPNIKNQLVNTRVNYRDYIKPGVPASDQEFLKYWGTNPYTEADYLDYLAFGANPAYRGISKQWYNNANKTNRALLGLGHTFLNNRTLGLRMLDHYGSLSGDQRNNAALGMILQQYIDLGKDFGEDVSELENLKANLPELIGENGKRFMSTAALYDEIRKKANPLYAKLMDKVKDTDVMKGIIDVNPYIEIEMANRHAIAQKAKEIEENPWDSGYYGLLKDPNVRRAAQYVAPWLMYGVPMAGLASMFGNNSLWPLILLGGLGSGAFGYKGQDWFGEDVMNKADKAFGTINSPVSYLANQFFPGGLTNDFSNLVNPQPKEKLDPDTPYIAPAEENDFLFDNMDAAIPEYYLLSQDQSFNASGNPYVNNGMYNPNALSYVNQSYNPMNVRSQYLGYA